MTFVTALMGLFLLSGAAVAMPAHAEAPAAPPPPTYTVALTGYNAVPEQTSDHPFVTASGAYSNPEIVAARSQDLGDELPFGTIIEIQGPSATSTLCGYGVVKPLVGYRIIADTTNARYTNRIDILFDTAANYSLVDGSVKNASTVLGICAGSTIRVVGFVNLNYPDRIPETQAALAALVEGKSNKSN